MRGSTYASNVYYAGAAKIDFVEYGNDLRSSGARPERNITQGDTDLG